MTRTSPASAAPHREHQAASSSAASRHRGHRTRSPGTGSRYPRWSGPSRQVGPLAATLAPLMGSLIKKRRKRMRKKKHKKMLKATRWQRRAGK
jgi:hypothetical protein